MNFIGFNLFTKLFHGLISKQMIFALVLPLRKRGRRSMIAPDLSATTEPAAVWYKHQSPHKRLCLLSQVTHARNVFQRK